jgi:enamine deaminase RidA (YjgF/YER057c/UK114 family)
MTSTRKLVALAALILSGCTAHASIETGRSTPDEIVFTGTGQGPISSGVVVPANRAYYWTSGIAPSVLNESAPAGSRERYGDTKTQAIGILRAIEAQLRERGLSLKDVVYMRVYLAPDKLKNNTYDFPGWFEAYGQFFNNANNPVRVARSSLGVGQLVNPDWLIEIEAVAVYH